LYILSPTISQNLYWNYENCKRITTRISVAFSLQKRRETARQTDRKEHIRLLLQQISWCVEERQNDSPDERGNRENRQGRKAHAEQRSAEQTWIVGEVGGIEALGEAVSRYTGMHAGIIGTRSW
jgi:hypothetical protein